MGRRAARRLLVVDDSTSITRMAKSLLEREGFLVRVAHSAAAAKTAIRRSVPDLVICDVIMPDQSGFDVLSWIRARPQSARVPVLLLSSNTRVEDKVKGLDIGADDYVTKPFRMDELIARVRSHLRVKTLQDEVVQKNQALRATQTLLEEKVAALGAAYDEIRTHQDRSQRALVLASRVQRRLLPGGPPPIEGWKVRAGFRPADVVAGDFYDFIERPDGRWLVTIGDVAGKGVPASLVMVMAQTTIRTAASEVATPGQLLALLNAQLLRDHGGHGTVTLFASLLSPQEGLLHFASAGHEFPLVINPQGAALELGVGGPFLGIFPEVTYSEGWVRIPELHRLVLFTDGIYDVPVDGRRLGTTEKLAEMAAEGPRRLDLICATLKESTALPGSDDVTLILADRIQRTRSAELSGWDRSVRGGLTVSCDRVNCTEAERFVADLVRWSGEPSLAPRVGKAASQIVESLCGDCEKRPLAPRLVFSVAFDDRGVVVRLEFDVSPAKLPRRLHELAPRVTTIPTGLDFEWLRP